MYTKYKSMAQKHNELVKKLIEEKEELEDVEDVWEENRLLQAHNRYTKEIKVTLKFFEHLVIEYGVP